MTSDATADLRALLASRHGAVIYAGRDERRMHALLTEAAAGLHLRRWTWSAGTGLAVDDGQPQHGTDTPVGALRFLAELSEPHVAVFLDAEPVLADPVSARLLKDLAVAGSPVRTLVLTGVGDRVPDSLSTAAVVWNPPLPGPEELAALVDRTAMGLLRSGVRVTLTHAQRRQLIDGLAGLTPSQAERLILQHSVADGTLDQADLRAIAAAKAQLLAADSPLDLIAVDATLDDVGGLTTVKEWLRKRRRGLEPKAREFGLPAPRGVLLTGVPGTGKSLLAKAVAGSWGLALVRLDTGRLHGSFVGESERRIRRALTAAATMAPVVLWIDEIEKVFGTGAESDSGVADRVLGVLLSWMQERPEGVFIVATSNDVSALPPELTRRGRLDEVFFVDLPDQTERTAILAGQLRRRGRQADAFDIPAIVAATEGFSGAELEAVVVGALYTAYCEDQELTTAHLLGETEATVPLSRLRAEDIAAIREWARGRAVRA